MAFFPQIMAGPITRAAHLLPQFDNLADKHLREEGLLRILYGLAKKLLLADSLGRLVVDPVYAAPFDYQGVGALLAAYAYTLQIYLDFSAYSDIAIGSAALLGIDLPENFHAPYLARNAKEYWDNWHISLSTWFRDYVYIPLGGNRQGETRSRYNVLATFLLSGLWHGAGLTFLFWGLLHGFYLICYRLKVIKAVMARTPDVLKRLLFFNLTALAFVFFRSADMAQAWQVLGAVFSYSTVDFFHSSGLILWAIALLPLGVLVHDLIEANLKPLGQAYNRLPAIGRGAVVYVLALLVYCGAQFDFVHQTFVYFKF
ncbi:MAG: Peptidoglycan O-acetyltransferase [Deltaproteobacteria bacterium ADurb.Bin510]|nr:MAG: Peptidoglycan O-acetyltransferase [Deltaproteobacteria bacterium ADurb.Bin510]